MSAVIAFFAAQIVKFLLEFWSTGTVKFERLLGNGGMPSSHSATVSALALGAGYCYGAASFEFAVSFILAMIVMTDAIGVRQETGKQSKLLRRISGNRRIPIYCRSNSRSWSDTRRCRSPRVWWSAF